LGAAAAGTWPRPHVPRRVSSSMHCVMIHEAPRKHVRIATYWGSGRGGADDDGRHGRRTLRRQCQPPLCQGTSSGQDRPLLRCGRDCRGLRGTPTARRCRWGCRCGRWGGHGRVARLRRQVRWEGREWALRRQWHGDAALRVLLLLLPPHVALVLRLLGAQGAPRRSNGPAIRPELGKCEANCQAGALSVSVIMASRADRQCPVAVMHVRGSRNVPETPLDDTPTRRAGRRPGG
jgi:hypothetical protein